MTRSRRPQCSTGRGCQCCGDAGAIRRAREAQGVDAIPVALVERDEWDIDTGWGDEDEVAPDPEPASPLRVTLADLVAR